MVASFFYWRQHSSPGPQRSLAPEGQKESTTNLVSVSKTTSLVGTNEDLSIRLTNLIRQERYDEAQRLLSSDTATDTLTKPFRAVLFFRQGEFGKSIALFQEAMQSEQPPWIHMEYAKALGVAGRNDESVRQMAVALKLDPELTEARVGLALAAYASSDLPSAREWVRGIAGPIAGTSEKWWLMIANAELEHGDVTNALRYCGLVLGASPKFVPARMLRAQILDGVGEYAEAAKDWVQATQEAPKELAVMEGVVRHHLQAQEPKRALEVVEEMISIAPTNTAIQFTKFQILGELRRFDEASSVLSQLRESLKPDMQITAESWLAERQGQTNRAIAILEPRLDLKGVALEWARLKLESGNPDGVVQKIEGLSMDTGDWVLVARIAEAHKANAVAVRCYDQALKQLPEDPGLLNNWAWNRLQIPGADLSKLAEVAQQALAKRPTDPNILDTYSEILLTAGRFQECVKVIRQYPDLLKDSPQLLFNLARGHESIGEQDTAAQLFKQCSEQAKAFKEWPLRASESALAAKMVSRGVR